MPRVTLPLPSAYELTARLKPALLTLLPLFLLAAIWLPEVWTFLGALVGLLSACGVTYLLAQIARHLGKALQARLVEDGPSLSTALLRHADDRIDPHTKRRHHALLASMGLDVPTADEESTDPIEADRRYRACTSWLLEATRDERRFKLLLQENISYGFRRNLLALKPIALPILVAAIAVNAGAIAITGPTWTTQVTTATFVEAGLFATLAIWLAVVRRDFLSAASLAYGLRLMACCDQLSAKAAKPARGRKTQGAVA